MDGRTREGLEWVLRRLQSRSRSVTVCFMDGTHRAMRPLEAVRRCAADETVMDAYTADETATALLRLIIDGNDWEDAGPA